LKIEKFIIIKATSKNSILNIKNFFNRNKFVKNTLIYTVSDFLNKMIPFALLPLLTHYLTPEDYGIISMFFIFVSILGVIMTLETNTAIGVKFFKVSRDTLKIYIGNILLIISLATSAVFVVLFLFSNWFSKILALPVEWIFIGVVVTLLQFLTTINLLLWQSEQKAIPFGLYKISETIINLSLSLVLIVGFGMGWEGRLIAVSLTTILVGLVSFSLLFKRDFIDFTIRKDIIKDSLNFGLPLMPHALSSWFRTSVNRVFLTTLLSASATGIFTVSFQISSVISVIAYAFDKAYGPKLYEKLKDITEFEKKSIVKYSYLYFLSLLCLAFLFSLTAPVFIDLFLDEKFQESKKYIVWISFGFSFYGMYLIVVKYVLFSQKTHLLSYLTISTSLVHVVLSYFFVLNYGILGAAQAMMISSLVSFLSVWWLSNRVFPMPWVRYK